MLTSAFTSPRRLALLAVFLFFVALAFVRNRRYSGYAPKYDFPTFSGSGLAEDSYDVPAQDDRDRKVPVLDELPFVKPSVVSSMSAVSPTPSRELGWPWAAYSSVITPTSTHIPAYNPPRLSNASRPIEHRPADEIKSMIAKLIKWEPLNTWGHWPPWDGYKSQDYDPNRWEGFEEETAYFTKNGIKLMADQVRGAGQKDSKPAPYLPYPEYNTKRWKKTWEGEYAPCKGARGKYLNDSIEDMVLAYPRLPNEWPDAGSGSAEATGLDQDVCMDRYHRYGAYGLGQTVANIADWDRPIVKPDWTDVKWGQLQDQCLESNKNRYKPDARQAMILNTGKGTPEEAGVSKLSKWLPSNLAVKKAQYHSRTAVLIRTWEGYSYTENDLQAIRALVTELSLLSGGEYQVYLFVNVKEHDANMLEQPEVYNDILKQSVPRELRDIAVLWNERICEQWYPDVGDWQVYWNQFMPVQWFSKMHPEFDFIWNWETDTRYTGNHYHLLGQVSAFSKRMPRKYLWERNQRFYFPAVHGTYTSFMNDTDATIASSAAKGHITPVWGALPYNTSEQTPTGPKPPHPESEDRFTWGVDEEADLITLQPIWNPAETEWSYRFKIWNFVPGLRPHFTAEDALDANYTHPDFAKIPRRTFINTVARFSKRQLHAMHVENMAGRTMQAEMWPATVALQHGLKAVYAPHPTWFDKKWPAWYLDAVFNADNGTDANWSQGPDSVYAHDREAQFRGWSWYYASSFPRVLYRRWLGWKAQDGMGDVGGNDFEEGFTDESGVTRGGNGRMCLPAMLLHPVKKATEDEV
ncbi:hypothetical protein LTR66_004104 [Elasticomyces elasticus]|nr:hypothetical protein LTR66_004104 [Elasticomyces elasticus]